jgi:hypothetical protein
MIEPGRRKSGLTSTSSNILVIKYDSLNTPAEKDSERSLTGVVTPPRRLAL